MTISSPKREEVIGSEEVGKDESEEELGDGVLEAEVISVSAQTRGRKEQKEAMNKAWPTTFAFPKAFSGRYGLVCMLRIQKFF